MYSKNLDEKKNIKKIGERKRKQQKKAYLKLKKAMLMIKNGDCMRNLLKNLRHILYTNQVTDEQKKLLQIRFLIRLGDRKHAFHHKRSTNKILTHKKNEIHAQVYTRKASCKNRHVICLVRAFPIPFTLHKYRSFCDCISKCVISFSFPISK